MGALESVPNVSEGRDPVVVEAIADALSSAGGHVLDVHVARLRRKLEDRGVAELVRTVRGRGYAAG